MSFTTHDALMNKIEYIDRRIRDVQNDLDFVKDKVYDRDGKLGFIASEMYIQKQLNRQAAGSLLPLDQVLSQLTALYRRNEELTRQHTLDSQKIAELEKDILALRQQLQEPIPHKEHKPEP